MKSKEMEDGKYIREDKDGLDKRQLRDMRGKGLMNLITKRDLNRQGDRLGDKWTRTETREDLY